MSGRYFGRIKYWNEAKQFGFAVTEDGEEFYVGAGRFIHTAGRTSQLPLVDLEGKHIRFDSEKKSDGAWTRRLNDGKLRDVESISHRDPRPPRRPGAKPVATNVVVIEKENTNGSKEIIVGS